MGTQVFSSVIANIHWLRQTFKYQRFGFQMHFKSILAYDLKTKSGFWSKYPHYIMDYITNLGSIFFLLSLVLNLAYIDYSLCQIWGVYMQYLLCCDYFNKWLCSVIQQAEVLLNFFWWVYVYVIFKLQNILAIHRIRATNTVVLPYPKYSVIIFVTTKFKTN